VPRPEIGSGTREAPRLIRDEGASAVPPCLPAPKGWAARCRANGRNPPPASHPVHRRGLPQGAAGEFSIWALPERQSLQRSAGAPAPWLWHARAAPGWRLPGAPCQVHTLPGSLADRLLLLPWPAIQLSGGPSGIRTHDLLNAIETRSQLRYGPLMITCGPGGIRTRDLFSAIEARSQLRYRPLPGFVIVTASPMGCQCRELPHK
jgi:hypothetical protein